MDIPKTAALVLKPSSDPPFFLAFFFLDSI
jgi:hypothetical protein